MVNFVEDFLSREQKTHQTSTHRQFPCNKIRAANDLVSAENDSESKNPSQETDHLIETLTSTITQLESDLSDVQRLIQAQPHSRC